MQRLHQEDFCQALGIGYEKKYQQDGGPCFLDCYTLIQKVSSKPIVDTESLLKWQIFNVLAGNSDGHAKNLALIYNERQQVNLAPFYDLVCTRAIERIDTKLALSVGGEFNPDNINIDHWKRLANECNIRQQYLIKILQQMAQALLDNVTTIKEQFEEEHGAYPALQRAQKIIIKQSNKVLKHKRT